MKLNKTIKLIILILISLNTFIIYKQTNHHNINYTAIGDNLTLGTNSFGSIDYSYSDYVNDYLKSKEKNNQYIKSFSNKYLTIEKLKDNIITNQKIVINDQEYNIRKTLRETNILTIQVGLNDLKYKTSLLEIKSPNNLDKIISELDLEFNELIKEIKKYYPYKIYIIGYYKSTDPYLNLGIMKLNNIFKNKSDIEYIDIYNIMENDHYYSNSQSYYPNYYGYEAIANEIINKISKKLEKSNNY